MTMNDGTEIFKCKKCGHEVEFVPYGLYGPFSVQCPNCNTSTAWYENPMIAVEVWNKEYGMYEEEGYEESTY